MLGRIVPARKQRPAASWQAVDERAACETGRGERCKSPDNELVSYQSYWVAKWRRKTEKEMKSLPNKKLHQLAWQEGTQTAMTSIPVEEIWCKEVGTKGKTSIMVTTTHQALIGPCATILHLIVSSVMLSSNLQGSKRSLKVAQLVTSWTVPQTQVHWSPECASIPPGKQNTDLAGSVFKMRPNENRRLEASSTREPGGGGAAALYCDWRGG